MKPWNNHRAMKMPATFLVIEKSHGRISPPSGVYLIAFESRLFTIWRSRTSSPSKSAGVFGFTFMPDNLTYAALQLSVVLSIPVLALYNGKRGPNPAFNAFMKWFFYIYYPLHLALIGVLKTYHMLPIYR